MKDVSYQPFTKFDQDWAIVTAGSKDCFNSMTVSWGSMGTLWGKPVITIYIRPDRYSCQFFQNNDEFTVSFYDESYRSQLVQMGRTSGRDTNKAALTGFTPQLTHNTVTYKQAKETFVCHKLLCQQFDKNLVPDVAKQIYQNGIEPHYMIIGEVIDYIKQ